MTGPSSPHPHLNVLVSLSLCPLVEYIAISIINLAVCIHPVVHLRTVLSIRRTTSGDLDEDGPERQPYKVYRIPGPKTQSE